MVRALSELSMLASHTIETQNAMRDGMGSVTWILLLLLLLLLVNMMYLEDAIWNVSSIFGTRHKNERIMSYETGPLKNDI